MDLKYNLSEAGEKDATQVLEVTNDAFMANTFFKKEEYHLRFDYKTVIEMINTPNSVFFIALASETSIADNSQRIVVGSLFLHWEIIEGLEGNEVIGKFSAVSVPSRYEKRGIGKALVKQAEEKVKAITASLASATDNSNSKSVIATKMQMGVINLRKDLFPWYEGQGYKQLGEIRPNDPEVERITLEVMRNDVCCILMSKDL